MTSFHDTPWKNPASLGTIALSTSYRQGIVNVHSYIQALNGFLPTTVPMQCCITFNWGLNVVNSPRVLVEL